MIWILIINIMDVYNFNVTNSSLNFTHDKTQKPTQLRLTHNNNNKNSNLLRYYNVILEYYIKN